MTVGFNDSILTPW